MRLLNDFFNILQKTEKDRIFVYLIRLNATHPIYRAHFPGNPVTPGACIIQITKELLEKQLDCSLRLKKIINLKFIKTVEPNLTPEVTFEFSKLDVVNNNYSVIVKVTHDGIVFTKQSLLFEKRYVPFLLQKEMDALKTCIIVSTYNSGGLVEEVLNEFFSYTSNIIVVDDGSTDGTAAILKRFPHLHTIVYGKNRGKGYALNQGFDLAERLGYENAITVDSDGQHKSTDLSTFLSAIRQYPCQLIIGNRNINTLPLSAGAGFANKFSNFWFTVQTGILLPDTQTGYRAYPIRAMKGMRAMTSRYEAEIELMVRIAWKGIGIQSVPVHVFYPQAEKRISHFRPFIDFVRISLLNSILVIFAVIYGYPSKIIRKIKF